MVKIIFFLGNPGIEYEKTRHNAGWIVCDLLYPGVSWKKKYNSLFYKENDKVLVKPQSFMNRSGDSIGLFLSFFNVKKEEVLVVHDDVELERGNIILKKGGGLKGHNGLKSISQQLGTNDFYRLKIGIGRPSYDNLASYVLGKFSDEEMNLIRGNIVEIKQIIATFGGK